MKFKYKKMIIVITMCTMCIGMVTISLVSPGSSGKENTKQEKTDKDNLAQFNEEANLIDEAGVEEKKGELEVSSEKELNNLIESYLNCRLTGDEEKLSEIVTDINNIDMDELHKLRTLIKEYKDVECYIVETEKKGNYIVYIYYEILFNNVDTPAPGLDRVYVITNSDGSLKLDFGLIPQEVRSLMEESEKSEKVQKIINTVNYKLEEAISKDEKLRSIYANLNGGSDEVENNAAGKNQEQGSATTQPEKTTEVNTSSKQPVETDEPLENTEAVRE
ncbi:MAG: hypothetical protein HFJ09_04170 [Lachnospiraceae bacterium]|nr:hypothetical protein [Lachnospiraceae bacterium]MCI8772301.1 hypothetical protein [Lachnospiraceae bacterium]